MNTVVLYSVYDQTVATLGRHCYFVLEINY